MPAAGLAACRAVLSGAASPPAPEGLLLLLLLSSPGVALLPKAASAKAAVKPASVLP
jgi:hypothetical protein